jgi:hypothetical protein
LVKRHLFIYLFRCLAQEPQFYIVTFEVLPVVNIRIDVLGCVMYACYLADR